MPRFDRYMLSQMTTLFGFFALVLVLVYWVNRAVRLFDQLIASGQSAFVFLEFTALTLPNVIRIVLPVAAFAATVYATNRLNSESELVVVQATGYSPARLARPVLVFGLLVAVLMSVLVHFLVPASLSMLDRRTAEIAENATAGLLTEGRFLHPADGITFYIREISPRGELRDIFLADDRAPGRREIYTARRAVLVRSETGPTLVMSEGMGQTLQRDSQSLSVTRFSEFAYELDELIPVSTSGPRSADELPTADLLWPSQDILDETGDSRALLVYEGHDRFAKALFGVTAPLIGFSVLLLGGFSRFGIWRQILAAVALVIAVDAMKNVFGALAQSDVDLWPLTYASNAIGLMLVVVILWLAANPKALRRRRTPA